MDIVITGYGQMGREVEQAATRRGHTVVARVDPVSDGADAKQLDDAVVSEADMVIEFAFADSVLENAKTYARCGTPAVVGTTGWEAHRQAVQELFTDNGAYLWGSNFSIGAHMFFAIAEFAAGLANQVDGYDLLMYEIHHKRKKDSPSGTALTIANRLLEAGAKSRIVTERLDRRREDDELHVASVRGGEIPGIHTVMIDSVADTIELRHTARNRGGLAIGAMLAAEWLVGKTGFYQVEDFVEELLGRGGM